MKYLIVILKMIMFKMLIEMKVCEEKESKILLQCNCISMSDTNFRKFNVSFLFLFLYIDP